MARVRQPLALLLAALLLLQPLALLQQAQAEDYDGEDDADALEDDEGEIDEPEDGQGSAYDEEDGGMDDGDEQYDDEEDEPEAKEPVDEPGSDVLSFNTARLVAAIESPDPILVEFYAPWCGHCKSLEPEYKKAATTLKSENVTLAKIDGTRETDMAEKYGVEGYPTIFLFYKGATIQYSGGRTSDDIVAWIRKKVGPPVNSLTDKKLAEVVLAEKAVIGIGYFSKFEGPEYEEYQSAAAQDDNVYFVQTTDAAIAALFGLDTGKSPAIAVIKKEDEKFVKFEGSFIAEDLSKFFKSNKLPLVITFSDETSAQIFGSEGSKRQLLLFANVKDYHTILPGYRAAALDFKGIIFVHINSSNSKDSKSVLDFFGMDESTPGIMAYESENDSAKFKMDPPYTEENIKAFAKGFVEGTLKPYLKSEPVPEKNDGNVKIVVGTTFDAIVLDDSRDVLLEVYAPWCSHCKKLAPVYEKLGKRFSIIDSVVIAKMDGTTNEHQRVKIEGFPTLYFFPAGNKSGDPITAEGHTLKALTKFLKQNAKIPFTLPKKGELAKEPLVEEVAEQKELRFAREDEDASRVKDEL